MIQTSCNQAEKRLKRKEIEVLGRRSIRNGQRDENNLDHRHGRKMCSLRRRGDKKRDQTLGGKRLRNEKKRDQTLGKKMCSLRRRGDKKREQTLGGNRLRNEKKVTRSSEERD